jgi:ABC-type uncharacterized transport system ATPase component
MTLDNFKRGSEWRKWDLHFHSHSSYDYQDKSVTDEELIAGLLEKGVEAVAITDHHKIDGTRIKNLQALAKDKILILPGIEFSSELGGSELMHYIGIFSENVDIDYIWKKLQVHCQIDDADIERRGGYEKVFCDFKETAKLIHELGGLVSVHAGKKSNSVERLKNHIKDDLEVNKCIDILEVGKETEQEDYHKIVFPNIERLIPIILCSDNHNIKSYSTKQNLWIKADLTFEGLKQIIYEPEERVYIGLSVARSKNDANVIDKIEINSANHWFEEEPILLNENLVTVIGEKGAGKTALADFVALAGGDFNVKGDDSGSFVSKALKSTKQIEETIDKCLVTIHWRDGSQNKITITKDFEDYKEVKKVRYLSQSFIERKCHPELAEELQKEIEDIIFQHIPIQDRMGQTTFVELTKLKSQSIEVRKTDCSKLISTLNKEIFGLEEEIKSLGVKKEEKSKLKTEVKQLEEQKPKPQTEEEKSIEAKLTILNNRKSTLNEQIAGLKLKLSTIETIKVKVVSLKEYMQGELSGIKKDLESVNLATLHGKLKFSVEQDFDTALDGKEKEIEAQIKKLQGTVDQDKNTQEKQTEPKKVELDELTDAYISALDINEVSPLISALESKSSIAVNARKTIKSFDEKIAKNQKRSEELDKSIKDIEETKKPLLPTKRTERDTAYKKYFALLQEEKQILEDIYSPLKEKLNKDSMGEKNQIDFFARIELNVTDSFNKADKVIDFSRGGTYCRKGGILFKEIKFLAEKIEIGGESDVHSLITQLYKTFEENDGKPVEISNQLLKGKNCLDFYKWIFDVSDFKVNYSIKYQDTNIELLSPGKKGIVLLLMYLALDTESSIPLIIDQPEENLDNKSLYPHLVDYFKIAKKRRQIIIVTHNPNLVLNTDAEQIIVANFEAVPNTYKARITYISGAIENSYINKQLNIPLLQQGIREHGVDILEGGRIAFIKRKEKYEY